MRRHVHLIWFVLQTKKHLGMSLLILDVICVHLILASVQIASYKIKMLCLNRAIIYGTLSGSVHMRLRQIMIIVSKTSQNSIWSWQRQKTFSWRHSQGDHMLVNPVSVVMPEWMLCLGMFCVILFGVCSPSVRHPVMSGVNPPSLPTDHIFTGCLRTGERGRRGQEGAGEAERRAVWGGGSSQTTQETWEDSQVRRHTHQVNSKPTVRTDPC